jgi:hypothetical protein
LPARLSWRHIDRLGRLARRQAHRRRVHCMLVGFERELCERAERTPTSVASVALACSEHPQVIVFSLFEAREAIVNCIWLHLQCAACRMELYAFVRCAADASFVVLCTSCSAALQVYLAAGTSSVRCDVCSHVFKVEVSSSDLPARTVRQRRQPRAAKQLPAVLVAFNRYKKAEMARLKDAQPTLSNKERLKQACSSWHNAPENPKNGGAAAGMEDGADGEAANGVHDGADGEAVAALQAMRRGGAEARAPAPAPAVPPPPPPRARPQRPRTVAPAAAPQAKRQRKGSKQKLTKDQCGGCGQRVDVGSYAHKCECGQLVHSSPFVCTGPTTLIREEDDRPEAKSGWLFLCREACRKHVT